MAIRFNADEVFGMAEQIERNGQKFYRAAAEKTDSAGVKKLLGDLAGWEAQHEKIFSEMRSRLSDEERASTAFDPQGEAELYLRAAADTHVFNVHEDPAEILAERKTAEQIIDAALDFERDSIIFFVGMKDLVPQRLGPDKVDRIIKEEIGHVAYLQRELDKLKA